VSNPSGKTQLYRVAVNRWVATTSYQLGYQILDPNGNVEQVTVAGVSGPSKPSWVPITNQFVPGAIVIGEGSVGWTNLGPPTPSLISDGSANDNDPAWGVSPTPVGLGIDVSETAGPGNNMPWQEIVEAGEQLVIVEAWKGQNINPYAESQLSKARQSGMATAVYLLLSYGFTPGSQAPKTACIPPAPATPLGSARWQVDQALELACTELSNLSFIAIDVEGYKAENLSPNDKATRMQYILDAIDEAKTFWVLNVPIATPPT